MTAGCRGTGDRGGGQPLPRKVRTPQGSAPGNSRAGQPDGPVAQKIYRLPELEAARPRAKAVRVKRCGKSAPRGRQRTWQAKPRTEQDQIGKRSRTARPKLPGRLLEAASDRGPRGMIAASMGGRRHGASRVGGRQEGHRIRLTGPLQPSFRRRPFPFTRTCRFPDVMALYVVTGGAGFIGSHLAETLLARGERVRVVDSLITGHKRERPAGRRVRPGRPGRPRLRPAGPRRRRLRAAPGGDPVGAAKSVEDPVTLEPRQHRRAR